MHLVWTFDREDAGLDETLPSVIATSDPQVSENTVRARPRGARPSQMLRDGENGMDVCVQDETKGRFKGFSLIERVFLCGGSVVHRDRPVPNLPGISGHTTFKASLRLAEDKLPSNLDCAI